jgi:hypothetical protein
MKAKSQTKKITAEPATKAQPEPFPPPPKKKKHVLGARPGTVKGDKAIWVTPLGGPGAFGGK